MPSDIIFIKPVLYRQFKGDRSRWRIRTLFSAFGPREIKSAPIWIDSGCHPIKIFNLLLKLPIPDAKKDNAFPVLWGAIFDCVDESFCAGISAPVELLLYVIKKFPMFCCPV